MLSLPMPRETQSSRWLVVERRRSESRVATLVLMQRGNVATLVVLYVSLRTHCAVACAVNRFTLTVPKIYNDINDLVVACIV